MAATILLPPSIKAYVTAITNAAYLQRITLTPPQGGTPTVWQGSGEGEHVIGTLTLTTPPGSQDLAYSVNAESSSNGGATWKQSALLPGGTTIGTLNIKVVLSEDGVDQDFNDAVLQIMWWAPL
jgi:hypothetical protein